MENNENSYKQINYKESSGFGKSVLIPFASGILGATLVIGTCFGVPSVRQKVLNDIILQPATFEDSTNSIGNNLNTNLVSLSSYSDTSVGVAKKIQPSVVGIKVEYTVNSIFSRNPSTASAEGSGVIITENGYILTNNHVISSTSSTSAYYSLSEATKISVYLYGDETEYEATVVGTDSQTDLAVIKVDKTGLTPAVLADSDSVQVGEFAMAAGNPLGMQNSITCGVVSAVEREVTDNDGKTYVLIQTDAAINSGNSGGALVNSNGEVIGINTLKLSGTGVEGMGFAIPINDTKDIYEQLIETGKVARPYIGIAGIDLDQATASKYGYPLGIYVKEVEDFSAGQKAGIKPGDVIIGADGTAITTMNELNSIKATHKIGDEMKLSINRNGTEMEIILTLAEQP